MAIRPTRRRAKGFESELVAFRCPTEILPVIDSIDVSRTAGLVRLLDQAIDARTAFGDLWIELEVRAHREGISEGEALGRLAREALKRQKK